MDVREAAMTMRVLLNQGGLGTGGFNFDAKLRRESTDLEDLFIAHIGGMDTLARGLLIAAKIREEGIMDKMLQERYQTWLSPIGAKIEAGKADFRELEQKALAASEPMMRSGRQEAFESILNTYL
jgi:xylose isomerase